MKASTAQFLALHAMAATMMFASLWAAYVKGHPIYYAPAIVLLIVALSTLKDFIHYFRLDLAKQG